MNLNLRALTPLTSQNPGFHLKFSMLVSHVQEPLAPVRHSVYVLIQVIVFFFITDDLNSWLIYTPFPSKIPTYLPMTRLYLTSPSHNISIICSFLTPYILRSISLPGFFTPYNISLAHSTRNPQHHFRYFNQSFIKSWILSRIQRYAPRWVKNENQSWLRLL